MDDVIYETVVKNPGSARRQMQAEMKCVQFARSTKNEITAHSFAIYGWLVRKLHRSLTRDWLMVSSTSWPPFELSNTIMKRSADVVALSAVF